MKLPRLAFLTPSLPARTPYEPTSIVKEIHIKAPKKEAKQLFGPQNTIAETDLAKLLKAKEKMPTILPLPCHSHQGSRPVLNLSRLFGPEGPKIEDVVQGNSGDCYHLAVLASLAHTGGLPSMVEERDQSGTQYRIHYFNYETGEKEFEDVFDASYVDQDNNPLYAGDKAGAGAEPVSWVKILENWFAKVNEKHGVIESPSMAGFNGISQGGWPDIPFKMITGREMSFFLTGPMTPSNLSKFKENLQKGGHKTVVLATKPHARHSKLVGSHAYAVLGMKGDNALLYNPWGHRLEVPVSLLFQNTGSYYVG